MSLRKREQRGGGFGVFVEIRRVPGLEAVANILIGQGIGPVAKFAAQIIQQFVDDHGFVHGRVVLFRKRRIKHEESFARV